MSRHKREYALRFCAAVLAVTSGLCLSQTDTLADGADIFNPTTAPVIHITVKAAKVAKAPSAATGATVTAATIATRVQGTSSFNNVVKETTAGAAASVNGELHIRGSHGQYSTYLDGAPLPPNVNGSLSDLINPKDIQLLRVYTGGFPAEYGGEMAAIFDVTAKNGRQGAPSGFVQDYIGSYKTNERTVEVGGSESKLSYFISALGSDTGFQLSPLSETAYHDNGSQSVLFGKFDYALDTHDRLTLDTASTGSNYQIPNDPTRVSLDQNDNQKENGGFSNLIWQHSDGAIQAHIAYYNHQSHLVYTGSPADLQPTPGTTDVSGLIETNENMSANTQGVRADYSWAAGKNHQPKIGLDVSTTNGSETFSLISPPSTGYAPITDNGSISGEDNGYYAQDDWKLGRLLVNYGARYDEHRADIVTRQLSPRANFAYTAGHLDKFHFFYDKLFQPAAIEDVRDLVGQSAIGNSGEIVPFQPERDDFFQVGWDHNIGKHKIGLDAYYRSEKNTVDDTLLGNTQIDVPINFQKGYANGLEATLDGPISGTVTYYANLARSWAKEHGPIVGGLLAGASPPNYFFDDHDQTDTASFGVDYDHHERYISFSGDYGSGYPYGELDDANGNPTALNYIFVPSHITFDFGAGMPVRNAAVALSVTNIFNHPYVITQAGAFSDVQWSQGRAVGVKVTINF